jgi:hypothetical protein
MNPAFSFLASYRSETRLKEAANSVTRWAKRWKLPEKTEIMLIHRRRPRIEGNTRFKLRVLIGTEEIEMVKKQRILGLTFDERLNWKEHIKDVKARATRKLNLLKSLAHRSWGSDQKTLADPPYDSLMNTQI